MPWQAVLIILLIVDLAVASQSLPGFAKFFLQVQSLEQSLMVVCRPKKALTASSTPTPVSGGPVFLPRRGLSPFAERMLADSHGIPERASLDHWVDRLVDQLLDSEPRAAAAG